jgi:hypothetical protein
VRIAMIDCSLYLPAHGGSTTARPRFFYGAVNLYLRHRFPALAAKLGAAGFHAVRNGYTAGHMAEGLERAFFRIARPGRIEGAS